jgi:uncharacterized membrane protein
MQNRIAAVLLMLPFLTAFSEAQEAKFIDFEQHIQPILEKNCLRCHGPEEAKNDFRVDDKNNLMQYVQPGAIDSSSLWTEYLVTKDPDLLMPPPQAPHPGGLSQADLLFIRTWITEGAQGEWRTNQKAIEKKTELTTPSTTAKKLWAFQGLFHPAAVHLPVALLSVSALFVFLSFFNRNSCEPVAFHCLWIGALGAVAACVTGWAYSAHEGYGEGFRFDLGSGIDRHRWTGVFVAAFSTILIPLSMKVRQKGEPRKRVTWLLASLVLLGSVSITGYQGGELTYGEDHYLKYYQELFQTKQTAEPATSIK